ncbi:MAG: tRNA (adenine-N1)-methyltransferase [Nitrososphaeraceae archaeon]
MKIEEGSYVLLFHNRSKKWLIKVTSEKKLHTHLGVIDIPSIIGMDYGAALETPLGKVIYLIKPTMHDFIMKSERRTQIVYPKDLGYIVVRTGLMNGSQVLEVGTGSGALTTFLASIVKPTGHIYSYDINHDSIVIAKRNLSKAGMSEFVTLIELDARQGINEKDFDVAIVDLGDPWTVVVQVYEALKQSGAFVAICPTINQVEKTAIALQNNDYVDIDCSEVLIRTIEAREGMTRPSMRMVGHTAYLIFGRKAAHWRYASQ